MPRNPEKRPYFPRTRQHGGEYNQEEESKAVSDVRQGVVKCGQRENLLKLRDSSLVARPRVGSCRKWKVKSRVR